MRVPTLAGHRDTSCSTLVHGACPQANNCTLHEWTTNSRVALATASDPAGPWTRLRTVVHAWSHNPEIVKMPDGTYVVYTLGDGTSPSRWGPEKTCVSSDAGGMPGRPAPLSVSPHRSSQDANRTVNFTMHYSSDLLTWQSKMAFIPDFPAVDNMNNWNPAPVVLPDGRVRLMVHTDPKPWAGSTIAEAKTWHGPYLPLTGDVTTCDHCQEDPFMWKDARDNWHVLYHRMFDPNGTSPVPSPGWPGGHAYSRDGLVWSNISRCYTTGFRLADGRRYETLRRERPKLLFNEKKQPTHLFNGYITPDHGVYTGVATLDLD